MRSPLFPLARQTERLQREVKSLHLTQWARVERKNKWRAENTKLKLILDLAVTSGWGLGHFWCIMSPWGGLCHPHLASPLFFSLFFNRVFICGRNILWMRYCCNEITTSREPANIRWLKGLFFHFPADLCVVALFGKAAKKTWWTWQWNSTSCEEGISVDRR